MVGQIENSDWVTTQWFKNTGDAIYLLGNPVDENDPLSGLGGSAYLQCLHGLKTGTPPPCDLEREKKLNEALLHLIGKGWIQSPWHWPNRVFLEKPPLISPNCMVPI